MLNNKDFARYSEKGFADEFAFLGSMSLFMQCDEPNNDAFTKLPEGFTFRLCRRNELEVWKRVIVHEKYVSYVTDFYEKVYAVEEDEFFRRCMFVCDATDKPIASGFIWRSYGLINTVAWLAVLPEYEGGGIGRALISKILSDTKFPVYLHTQPTSARAIKLYSDFGFKLVTNPTVGYRKNDLEKSLEYLQAVLPPKDFNKLQFATANDELLAATLSSETAEF